MYKVSQEIKKFEELSEDMQESVINRYRFFNVDWVDWSEYTIDMMKDAGALIGISIDRVYFSGFHSQGDGACFEGSYEYSVKGLHKVRKEFPTRKELHTIAENLQEIQRKAFYALSARVKHLGHYYHELCTCIDVDIDTDTFNRDVLESEEEGVIDLLRDFMRLIYKTLEKEYEWLTSDEEVKESLVINEYDFDENGKIY